jgi:hypothetical protein
MNVIARNAMFVLLQIECVRPYFSLLEMDMRNLHFYVTSECLQIKSIYCLIVQEKGSVIDGCLEERSRTLVSVRKNCADLSTSLPVYFRFLSYPLHWFSKRSV